MSAEILTAEGLAAAMRRYPIIFAHLGIAYRPLLAEWERCVDMSLTLREVLESGAETVLPRTIIVTEVEMAASSRRLTLSSLRERIMREVDRGSRFVLVSSLARNAFPPVPGSDLLADAKHVFPEADASQASDLDSLPGYRPEATTRVEFLSSCLQQLDAETTGFLSELLWEAQLSPREAIARLTGVHLDSLRGAGLVAMREQGPHWVTESCWSDFKEGVAQASSNYLEESDWLSDAFVGLWIIERRVRNAIRQSLVAKYGSSWRSSCLPPALQTEVVERARKDGQASANRVEDLRDPLEWLTIGELLDVRTSRELGTLGIESYMWARFRTDIVPVRNRSAHMRILSEKDARIVGTWVKVVAQRVKLESALH